MDDARIFFQKNVITCQITCLSLPFWDITPCNLMNLISVEHIVSIFRVDAEDEKQRVTPKHKHPLTKLHSIISDPFGISIVTYRPIARQRLRKHTPAGANARNNRTSIATQRISKHA
jgi:hypothetical protein